MNKDYAGAEVLEARNYGYSTQNHPKAWCLHTSEGFNTARYFHTTDRQASTHYVVEQGGKVWQCVPESEGAYANAVEGKPYPAWADPSVNLNLQTIGVEIEGFAWSVRDTMPRGSVQWNALVELLADRCKALGMPPENTIGHYMVSTNRSDPGTLDIGAVIEDVQKELNPPIPIEEDDMALIVTVAPQTGGDRLMWAPETGFREITSADLAVIDALVNQGEKGFKQATIPNAEFDKAKASIP